MAEKPKLQSDVIVPAETCRNEDLGFFERPTPEFKVCKEENRLKEFQEYLKENQDLDFISLAKKMPFFRQNKLRGTKYDPLKYYPHPPVIGVLGIKLNPERTEYIPHKDSYGEKYSLVTTDVAQMGGNRVFIEYKGYRGLLTAYHLKKSTYNGLDGVEPHSVSDSSPEIDISFIELDDNFHTHIKTDTHVSRTSPIDIVDTAVSFQGELVSTISYDEGGKFSDQHEGLKAELGIAVKVTEQYEQQMIDYWVSTTEDPEKQQSYRGRKGRYVGSYVYRITAEQNVNGGGISGSPVFQESHLVGILTRGLQLGDLHLSVFTPINQIEDKVLSKIR